MSFFDKLKNVLFEDDDETVVEEERPKREEVKKEEVRFNSQSSAPSKETIEPKKEPSVFQSFDEEEFDRIAAINKNRLLERDRKAREEKEKEEEKRRLEAKKERENLNAGYRRYEELRYGTSNTSGSKEIKDEVKPREVKLSETPKDSGEYRQNIYNKPVASKEPVKKFTPSPVISPVYGVLDKNYRKEDILPRASSEGTLPKIMDVDNVRKKAFGILEKNIDTEENEPLKDFSGENEMKMEDISKELEADEEIGKTTRIDIADIKDIEEDIREKAPEEKKELTDKSNKNDEEDSLEKDLFNLIDSMYESREDK